MMMTGGGYVRGEFIRGESPQLRRREVTRAAELYGQGVDVKQIADKLDLSVHQVYRRLATAGVDLRPRGPDGLSPSEARDRATRLSAYAIRRARTQQVKMAAEEEVPPPPYPLWPWVQEHRARERRLGLWQAGATIGTDSKPG